MLFSDPFTPLINSLGRSVGFLPALDVTTSDGDMVCTFDLPGLTAADVDLELRDGYLTVRGERRLPESTEGTTWSHTERPYGRFERRIRIPEGVDAESVTATMENGVLSLLIPKPERLKPKSISIQATDAPRQLEHS